MLAELTAVVHGAVPLQAEARVPLHVEVPLVVAGAGVAVAVRHAPRRLRRLWRTLMLRWKVSLSSAIPCS